MLKNKLKYTQRAGHTLVILQFHGVASFDTKTLKN